jgi:hypothetical protein
MIRATALASGQFLCRGGIFFPFRTLCERTMEAGMNRIIDRRRNVQARVARSDDGTRRNESVLETVFGLAMMALICAAGITMKVLIWG